MIKRSDILVTRRKHVAYLSDDVLFADLQLHSRRIIDSDCSEEDRQSETENMLDQFMRTLYGEIKEKVEEAMSFIPRLETTTWPPGLIAGEIEKRLREIRSMCEGRSP